MPIDPYRLYLMGQAAAAARGGGSGGIPTSGLRTGSSDIPRVPFQTYPGGRIITSDIQQTDDPFTDPLPPTAVSGPSTLVPDLPPGLGGSGSFTTPETPNLPHQGIDVPRSVSDPYAPDYVTPPSTTPFTGDIPDDFVSDTPNQYNPVPNDFVQPPANDLGYFPGDQPPDYSNIMPQAPVTFAPNYFGDMTGGPVNPPPNETMYPTEQGYNPPTNETMYPTDLGYFPADQHPDFTNLEPAGDYQTRSNFQEEPMPEFPNIPPTGGFQEDFDTTGEMQNPPGGDYASGGQSDLNITSVPALEADSGQFLQNIPTDFVTDTGNQSDPGTAFDFGVTDPSGIAIEPGQLQNQGSYDESPPSAPAIGSGMPDHLVPTAATGTLPFGNMPSMTFDAGANIYHDTTKPGLLNELRLPTDYQGLVNNIKDIPGNIKDFVTGLPADAKAVFDRVVAAGGSIENAVKAIGSAGINLGKGIADNIMNDPGYSSPDYLASIGYHEIGPEGSGFMLPAGVTGPTVGTGDIGVRGAIEGGSYFHGGASAGARHGATSVAGALYNLGGSGPINAAALGARSGGLSILDRQYLRRMFKGLYTSSDNYGERVAGAPSPFSSGGSPVSGGNWNAFHAGQVQLGDILRSNPAYYNSLTASMPKTGLGPGTPGSRATRGTPPTQPV